MAKILLSFEKGTETAAIGQPFISYLWVTFSSDPSLFLLCMRLHVQAFLTIRLCVFKLFFLDTSRAGTQIYSREKQRAAKVDVAVEYKLTGLSVS
jgi:hypothetical protein